MPPGLSIHVNPGQPAPAPPDPSQQPQQPQQGQMPPALAAALGMGGQPQQPGYGQAPDPQTQAVWSEFPSTDPDHLAQLAQQAGSVEALMPELLALIGQDEDKLRAMQRQQLDAILHMLMAPSGPAQPPGPPLGVGGQSG